VIIPEKLRERHWKGYFQTMATGYTRYGDKLSQRARHPIATGSGCRSSSVSRCCATTPPDRRDIGDHA
jgi:hypothetical protein